MPLTIASTTDERFGFVVERDVCAEYESTFGTEVECVDIE